jgi:copper chaperone CopZ
MASKFTQISFRNLRDEVTAFLQTTYNKADQLFSPSSPYGQILQVSEELFQLAFIYLQNAINQFDLSDVNSNNRKIVRSAAIAAGHNPTRAVSATGTLKLRLNASTDIEKDIPGKRITIFNKTTIKNKTNDLKYSIDLGGLDKITYPIKEDTQFFVNIIQGEWKVVNLTGDGSINQSYSVQVPGTKEVENFNVRVEINGNSWEIKKHLYEMLPDEEACIVKTGFNSGIMVVFGNGSFGAVPPIGSEIRVSYVETDGSQGNIFRRTTNDWLIIGDVVDGFGTNIDLSSSFDIFIHTDINFGADNESTQFTRSLLPISSNNFVLALPQQYAFAIKKLGVFSHVNAYQNKNDDTIYIVCTPNIQLFKNRNADYFTVDLDAFILDNYEKTKIDNYLKISGNIQLTRKYKIDSPKLSYYSMNVFVIFFDDVVEETVNDEIRQVVSEYFLDFKRMDRVPKNDLINIISEVDGVDSVDISFVSKKNEDYHREYIEKYNNKISEDVVVTPETATIQQVFPDYNPSEVRGLDPILGDIVFEASEIPIIRGGWKDRNGVFYSANPGENVGFSSLNVIKKGVTPRKNVNK